MSDEAYRGEHVPPEETRRPPSKKDTRRWCKGKVGREHVRQVELQEPPYALGDPCRWFPLWRHPHGQQPASWRWSCHHQEVCTVCSKVLRWTLELDCPDLTPQPTEALLHPRVR